MQQPAEERVNAVRTFNRFWTKQIGALGSSLLHTEYSLTEARVIFELAQRDSTEVADLRHGLDLDPGYMSRILAQFKAAKLVITDISEADARRQVVKLTRKGRRAFEVLNARSTEDVRSILGELAEVDQQRLVGAMAVIRRVLDRAAAPRSCVLRQLGPGDLGWVVQRHGALYAHEYQWDERFEALVARIVADYVEQRDPRKDNAWIAEVDHEPAGCVFCVRKDANIAQLRLLLVEPRARGLGVGARLVEECIRFARHAGYTRMVLCTNHPLRAARRIYERAGFHLVAEQQHHSFGHDLVGQNFELTLTGAADGVRQGGASR
jgi:DNA-binding MarR family transcriptional regulator/N-acetylglutamate synthase-like GNAT family acetyltransferase